MLWPIKSLNASLAGDSALFTVERSVKVLEHDEHREMLVHEKL